MDRALEARDPYLASMFAIFTRLTRDDGPPRTELLARGPNPFLVLIRGSCRWAKASTAIPIVLVASLMAAIIALGIATSSGSVCPPAAAKGHAGQIRTAVCQYLAHGIRK
jgi:hypothetical protein